MAFNIMVVDDSETMRSVIKKVVSMSGIAVGDFHEAGHGKEALEILDEAWVDVILSDINMPEMNGIELLQAIKKNDVLSQIPVIFITTEASQARMDEATKHGAAGYVKKPFMPETIKKVLLDVLEKAYAKRFMDDVVEDDGSMNDETDF